MLSKATRRSSDSVSGIADKSRPSNSCGRINRRDDNRNEKIYSCENKEKSKENI